jgi:hypothetical protein
LIESLFGALLRVHLTCALGATTVFWVSASVRKGGVIHRAAGHWFARLVYATAVTGAVMAIGVLAAPDLVHRPDLTQPVAARAADANANRQTMWLVLYVLLIIVAPVQHGVAVAMAGPNPSRTRSPLHATLSVASLVGSAALLPAALLWEQWMFLIVVPIGGIVGLRNMHYAARRQAHPDLWRREHLTSLITAGITLHTAFFVFGTSRSLALSLPGVWQLVPWVAPALVGLPVILWWRSRALARVISGR